MSVVSLVLGLVAGAPPAAAAPPFVVPDVLTTPSDSGHLDLAYHRLKRHTYPSWLYPVKQGATTIWERWDGQKPDGTFQDAGMNSFNHYAYGAIGEWMYRVVAGIEIDPREPGYKHGLIQPQPGGGLTSVEARLDTMPGVTAARQDAKAVVVEVGSGAYAFAYADTNLELPAPSLPATP